MKTNYKYFSVFTMVFLFLIQISIGATINDFLNLSYKNPVTNKVMKYRLFVPKNYDKNKIYPMIGFLHGAGEGDPNNTKQVEQGCLFWAADSIQNKYPSFILAPNIDGNDGYWATAAWGNGNYKLEDYKISESLQNYINIIQLVKSTYSVDSNRVYSTGWSMGGGGTWASLMRFPKLFAAAIPICGYGDPSKMASIKDIPIWTFHGSADGIISVETTRGLVQALKNAGSAVKYNELAGKGHVIWAYGEGNDIYYTRGLADWLFAQKRKDAITDIQDNINLATELIIYPNPSIGIVTIKLPKANFAEIVVTNIQGKIVLTHTVKSTNSNEEHIDLTVLPKGIYTISTKNETNILIKKINIE